MSLYRIVEVPDPSGQLADMIEELLDNSALVEADPGMVRQRICDVRTRYGHNDSIRLGDLLNTKEMDNLVNAALGIDPPEET